MLKLTGPAASWLAILLVALSLSIGWGVRGNWGHEYGAMIPGALAAMAAVIVSGRDDWHRRIALFAFFGAIGWSFGGSISYMKVIAYTHSGDALSVAYGLACLFLIGFLWAAMGGAGTAVSAFLNRQQLTELLIPTLTVCIAWVLQDVAVDVYLNGVHFLGNDFYEGLRDQLQAGLITKEDLAQQTRWLNWHDTDWLAVVVAAGAVLLLAVVRRRIFWGTELALYMCAGWWIGFTGLTLGLGLRMTPPRGDNWAGALGMTVAMFLFLYRRREWAISWTALVVGVFGGIGFSGATMLKLVLIHPEFQRRVFGGEIQSNWHSVLEQSFGFISGVGVAVAMAYWSTRAQRQDEQPPVRRWAEPAAVFFVLIAITYVNIVKNLESAWLKPGGILQNELWGWPTRYWFNAAYVALAIVVALPLVADARGREMPALPSSRLGKAQFLYLVFLWWIVIGNLARTVPFAQQRLITEGVIHINACLCTLLVLLLPRSDQRAPSEHEPNYTRLLQQGVATSFLVAVLVIASEYGIVRGMWHDTFAGQATLHIRFGPKNTNDIK